MLHLIEWNTSHSCFSIQGHFFTRKEAKAAVARIRKHFNYKGNDLEIISDYQLGYLEGAA